jgi:hypothetical protein
MPTKRRGGFHPPELRGTLGTLLRTTTDVVRGALERGAREGRARLDDVRTHRRRQDALAELGDIVLDLIRRGEIDLAELPEARDLVRQLDDFDAADAEPEPARAITRRRFDDRPTVREAAASSRPRRDDRGGADARGDGRADGRGGRGDDGLVSSGARRGAGSGIVSSGARPRRDDDGGAAFSARPRRDLDDGVVASSARPRHDLDDGVVASSARPRHDLDEDGAAGGSRFSRPTMQARPRPSDSSSTRTTVIARPTTDDPDSAPPSRRPSLTLPHDPHRKGGISFDDDDLNEYMHPDDVPSKSPPKDPDDGDA